MLFTTENQEIRMDYRQVLYGIFSISSIYYIIMFYSFYIYFFLLCFNYMLLELQKKEGNNVCIDCGAPNPQWYVFYYYYYFIR